MKQNPQIDDQEEQQDSQEKEQVKEEKGIKKEKQPKTVKVAVSVGIFGGQAKVEVEAPKPEKPEGGCCIS